MKEIAIQGVAGCFHDAAAREYFSNEEIATIPCDTFPSLFSFLDKNPQKLGIVAIENTIAGSILQNHELLRRSNLTVIGEYKKYISHVLASLPDDDIATVKEVNSHPMALMQCEKFLMQYPHMKIVEKTDTAGSAMEIAQNSLRNHAAVCGKYAADLYGLKILAEDIQTNKRNFTRFLIVAHNKSDYSKVDKSTVNKASLVFTLPHTHGSLSKVLTIFAFYDINLSKIQSLPIIGKEWEYQFYVNVTFDDYDRYRQSISAVMPLISDFKILGEYAEYK